MAADAQLSYRTLPLRFVEDATCFRRVGSGGVRGLAKQRAFSFLEMHTFCATRDDAFEEYLQILRHHMELARRLGWKFIPVFESYPEFVSTHPNGIRQLATATAGPLIIQQRSLQKSYWCLQHMFHGIDGLKFFNCQLDHENGVRFDIKYSSRDQERRTCSIVHSTYGTFERWMLMFLNRAFDEEPFRLPLWLSPVQVRFVPVNDRALQPAIRAARTLRDRGVRADVDDRSQNVNWRIRQAAQEWVPNTIVFGPREEKEDSWLVRKRDATTIHCTPGTWRITSWRIPGTIHSSPSVICSHPAFRDLAVSQQTTPLARIIREAV